MDYLLDEVLCAKYPISLSELEQGSLDSAVKNCFMCFACKYKREQGSTFKDDWVLEVILIVRLTQTSSDAKELRVFVEKRTQRYEP